MIYCRRLSIVGGYYHVDWVLLISSFKHPILTVSRDLSYRRPGKAKGCLLMWTFSFCAWNDFSCSISSLQTSWFQVKIVQRMGAGEKWPCASYDCYLLEINTKPNEALFMIILWYYLAIWLCAVWKVDDMGWSYGAFGESAGSFQVIDHF